MGVYTCLLKLLGDIATVAGVIQRLLGSVYAIYEASTDGLILILLVLQVVSTMKVLMLLLLLVTVICLT